MFNSVLSEGKIGNLSLKNRFVVPPMGTARANLDGSINDNIIEYYKERAKGGFGLIILEVTGIDPLGKAIPEQVMLDDDKYIPGLRKLVDAVHGAGAKIFPQLHHAGRAAVEAIIGAQSVAPSAIGDPMTRSMPRELTTKEVYDLIEKFSDAAVRSKKAGFDGVEIHGAHGYLVCQFLSGFSNKRIDEFGGSLAGRAKFAIDIVKSIKAKCGNDFPVCMRISANERVKGGLKEPESATIACMLEKAGADAIHVSTGVYASMPWIIAPSSVEPGYILESCKAIKDAVKVPVIAVGRITEPYLANQIVASGIADFVSIGRGSISDPYLPQKTQEGRVNEILSCVGCMTRCQGVVAGSGASDRGVSCMVNPFAGHEDKRTIEKTKKKKKVVVVGGGPAGLESAWILAARGHDVTLFEKSNKVGGQFLPAAVPPGKHPLISAIYYYNEMCKKHGVKMQLGVEANAKRILDLAPDDVILSTGGVPLDCNFPVKDAKVVQAVDALENKYPLGENVLIVGGGLVGLETALHIASQGKKVTVTEMEDEIGKDMQGTVKYFTIKSLADYGVKILTRTKVMEVNKEGTVCEDISGQVNLNNYDMIVLAIGAKAYNPLYEELKGKVEGLYVIGDAREARKGVEAIEEAVQIALAI